MFFIIITAIFAVFLIVVSLIVFLSKPKEVLPIMVFNKPKITIDMKVFELNQFKNLQRFTPMQIQFSYTAKTSDNKPQTGFISAASEEQAREILEGMDLTVSNIKETATGRDNPFIPYYQVTVATATARR